MPRSITGAPLGPPGSRQQTVKGHWLSGGSQGLSVELSASGAVDGSCLRSVRTWIGLLKQLPVFFVVARQQGLGGVLWSRNSAVPNYGRLFPLSEINSMDIRWITLDSNRQRWLKSHNVALKINGIYKVYCMNVCMFSSFLLTCVCTIKGFEAYYLTVRSLVYHLKKRRPIPFLMNCIMDGIGILLSREFRLPIF